MAALVSMTVAKQHLRIDTPTTSPPDAGDADISLKMEQASDIIVGYLKGRAIVVESITSDGAGLATVTTRHLHGLTSTDVVVVRGAVEPEYNGSVVATVTSTTTFTYPITGIPATPATGAVAIRALLTWDSTTVPARVQAAVLLMLTHLYEKRGDDPETDAGLWEAIGRLLARDRDPALA